MSLHVSSRALNLLLLCLGPAPEDHIRVECDAEFATLIATDRTRLLIHQLPARSLPSGAWDLEIGLAVQGMADSGAEREIRVRLKAWRGSSEPDE